MRTPMFDPNQGSMYQGMTPADLPDASEWIQRPGAPGGRYTGNFMPQRRYGAPQQQMPGGAPQFNGTPVTPVGGGQMGIHSQTMPYLQPPPMANRSGQNNGGFKSPLQTTQSAYPGVLQKNGGLWAAMQRALQTPGVGANGTQVPMPMNPYAQQWASDPNGYGGYGRR